MNVILLHGKDTDPSKKWYPWFITEVTKCGLECIAPTLPKADDPLLGEWIAEINKTQPDEQTILVGHSRGGVAILRWLEALPVGIKVKAVMLVATNSGHTEKMSTSENSKTFFSDAGYDFKKIKTHCDRFVVFHSRDDATVPFAAGEENAKGLNATFHQFDGLGHLGSTVSSIPELLDEIKQVEK